MSNAPTNVSEHAAIAKIVQHYIDGAKSGRGGDMKPAFHKDATFFGNIGADVFGGPIQQLFDWNDENGPATKLQARIAGPFPHSLASPYEIYRWFDNGSHNQVRSETHE